jgi:hypothetical protein
MKTNSQRSLEFFREQKMEVTQKLFFRNVGTDNKPASKQGKRVLGGFTGPSPLVRRYITPIPAQR